MAPGEIRSKIHGETGGEIVWWITYQRVAQGFEGQDVSQAMKGEEPRLICPQPKGGRTISIGKPVGP